MSTPVNSTSRSPEAPSPLTEPLVVHRMDQPASCLRLREPSGRELARYRKPPQEVHAAAQTVLRDGPDKRTVSAALDVIKYHLDDEEAFRAWLAAFRSKEPYVRSCALEFTIFDEWKGRVPTLLQEVVRLARDSDNEFVQGRAWEVLAECATFPEGTEIWARILEEGSDFDRLPCLLNGSRMPDFLTNDQLRRLHAALGKALARLPENIVVRANGPDPHPLRTDLEGLLHDIEEVAGE